MLKCLKQTCIETQRQSQKDFTETWVWFSSLRGLKLPSSVHTVLAQWPLCETVSRKQSIASITALIISLQIKNIGWFKVITQHQLYRVLHKEKSSWKCSLKLTQLIELLTAWVNTKAGAKAERSQLTSFKWVTSRKFRGSVLQRDVLMGRCSTKTRTSVTGQAFNRHALNGNDSFCLSFPPLISSK